MLRKSSPAYWQVDSWGPWPNLGLGRFYGQKNPLNGLKCPLLSPFEAAISEWWLNCSGNLLLHMDKWFLGVLAKPCSGQKQAHINLLGFKSCLINCVLESFPFHFKKSAFWWILSDIIDITSHLFQQHKSEEPFCSIWWIRIFLKPFSSPRWER